MWFYLFGRDGRHPDPGAQIEALASLDRRGEPAFLKLSVRDVAPLKGPREGQRVHLCVRDGGRWSILGDAEIVGAPIRGETPPSMVPLHGPSGEGHWWRRLGRVRLHEAPRSESELGLAPGTLPANGRAHVVHVASAGDGAAPGPADGGADPLAELTAVIDAVQDGGRLTPEAIEEAIRQFRAGHPYAR